MPAPVPTSSANRRRHKKVPRPKPDRLLGIFYWGIVASGILQPGEDAVEPLALMAAPFALNICYTLGWLVELAARIARPALPPQFGPWLLRIGLGFSLFVISIPAVYWGGYRVLQLVHVLR